MTPNSADMLFVFTDSISAFLFIQYSHVKRITNNKTVAIYLIKCYNSKREIC